VSEKSKTINKLKIFSFILCKNNLLPIQRSGEAVVLTREAARIIEEATRITKEVVRTVVEAIRMLQEHLEGK